MDVGGIDVGGGGEVDDAVFVSPVNEDIMSLLWFSTLENARKQKK